MRKLILTLFIVVGFLTSLFSCSNNESTEDTEVSSDVPKILEVKATTIQAQFIKSANNKAIGDFTKVYFEVENYSEHTLLTGPINCTATDKLINCETKTDLTSLQPGIYRLLLNTKNDGLLGSDLFEIMPGVIPVVVTIDNESTGFYLISLITKKSGIREDEIYARVRNILGGKPNEQYDLEPTLYDLFMYYKGDDNFDYAMNKLVTAIKLNEPLKGIHADGVNQALKPLF